MRRVGCPLHYMRTMSSRQTQLTPDGNYCPHHAAIRTRHRHLGRHVQHRLVARLLDVRSVPLMRGWPVFMIERPMVLAIVVVLLIVAATAIGVLLSGYGNCC
jgi:hypothetical protein